MALTMVPVSAEEMAKLTRRAAPKPDLSEYIGYVAPLPVDSWYKAELSNGDDPKKTRRYLNKAANEVGKDLTFKPTVDNDDGSYVITFHVGELTDEKVAARKLRAEQVQNKRAAAKGKQLVAI